MKIKFKIDNSLCSGCGACAVACMDQNDIDTRHGQKPFRRIQQRETPASGFVSTSVSCAHCENAPCVKACPKHVLYKDTESGLTLFDNESCVGCRACAKACPFDAISFNAEGRMVKCDGCVERIKAGLDPACAHTCPTGALTWSMTTE